MRDAPATAPAGAHSIFGLGTVATAAQRRGALAVCSMLLLVTVAACVFGRSAGPEIKPFVPITATIGSLADLLTAFLLIAQFYVNGSVPNGLFGIAYAFMGYMSLAFLAAFPGLFRTGPLTLGDEQLSSVVWWTWHVAFPIIIMYAVLNEAALGRIVSRRRIHRATIFGAVLPLLAAVAFVTCVFAFRNALPHLIVRGEFQPIYRTVLLPFVIALNALGCMVLLAPRKTLTPLVLWVAVAMFAGTLDSLMVDIGSARYSYAWDVGKVMTVVTSTIVLLMILCDIVGLYGRLARIAGIDVLTSVATRRAYEERFEAVFDEAQRLRGSLALLVIDVDFFKRYNDSFGHLGGDECLRWVARALVACATRPLDLVARYGGEEFVIILPDTPLHGTLVIAERIRSVVERLEIVHGAQALGKITVSIGICYTSDARKLAPGTFFETADRALYDAKEGGRNRVVLGTNELREPMPYLAPVARAKRVDDQIFAKTSGRVSRADDGT